MGLRLQINLVLKYNWFLGIGTTPTKGSSIKCVNLIKIFTKSEFCLKIMKFVVNFEKWFWDLRVLDP